MAYCRAGTKRFIMVDKSLTPAPAKKCGSCCEDPELCPLDYSDKTTRGRRINVPKGKMAKLTAHMIPEGVTVLVSEIGGAGKSSYCIPYMPLPCFQPYLSCALSTIYITDPGSYVLEHDGEPGSVKVCYELCDYDCCAADRMQAIAQMCGGNSSKTLSPEELETLVAAN